MKKPTSKQPGLQDRIVAHFALPNFRPSTRPEIAKAMRINAKERNQLRQALTNLEKSGKIMSMSRNRWALPQTRDTITGILRVLEKGFGLFSPDNGGDDIYIAKDDLKCAIHEDRVSVERLPQNDRKAANGRTFTHRNAEGRVTEVLERKFEEVVGLLRRNNYFAYVIPDNMRINHDIRVTDWAEDIGEIGDDHKVVIRLNEWNDPFKPLTGEVIEDIGHSKDTNVEMQCILRSHGFRQKFSPEVLAAAEQIPSELRPSDYENRTDLRERLTFTIDPETARDFDDAISIETIDDGFILSVHIADVAHFVPRDSVIDVEALHRGNSIYLVDRVVMMIPTELTTKICSLNPNVDRLAHTVELTLNKDGEIQHVETCCSVIHSNARLTYEQVQTLFDGKNDHGIPAETAAAVQVLRPLARKLRKTRTENGSLELSTPQIKCVMGENGKVTSITKGEAHEAYQLIEECMLLANIAVARKLKGAELAAIHRIHEEPDADQWAQMGAELQTLGIDALPKDRADINATLEKIKGTPLEYAGTLAVLRNLKRAEYAAKSNEHFGLAFDDYAHFTSPIRRYPDLVIHRLLTALERGEPTPYKCADIEGIAAQCTRTEKEADAAEKDSVAMRRAEFYQDLLAKKEIGPFKAHVVKVLGKGLLIEIPATLQRGLVSFTSITDDRYELNGPRTRATGKNTGAVYQIGTEISVDLLTVDVPRKFVDFRIHGQEQFCEKNKGAPQRRKKNKKNVVSFNGGGKYGASPKKRRKRK